MITTIEAAFSSAVIEHNILHFPVQIEERIYKKAKQMLEDIRGCWVGGNKQQFEFNFSPQHIIESFLAGGSWPKKNPHAFFPTPKVITDYIIQWTEANPDKFYGREVVRIIEPSAGSGHLIDAVCDAFHDAGIQTEVLCVEIDPVNVAILKEKGYKVIQGDFLEQQDLGLFDLAVTNPPFMNNLFIKHILRTQSLLKNTGKMVAVTPTSLFSKGTRQAKALKEQVAAVNIGDFDDCVFKSGVFDNTDVETMVFSLLTESKSLAEVERLKGYAAEICYIYIKNDRHVSPWLSRCKSRDEVLRYRDTVLNTFKRDNPYGFINDKILDEVMEMFVRDITPISVAKKAPQAIVSSSLELLFGIKGAVPC